MKTLMTWIDGTLNHPIHQFRQVTADTWQDDHLGLAALWVALVSLIQPMAQSPDLGSALLGSLFAVIAGLISWVCLGLILHAAAMAFARPARQALGHFLVLSALALVPWVLTPSLTLLQHSAAPGLNVLAALLQWSLWFWSFGLLCLAISQSYRLAWQQVTLTLVLVPLVGLLGWAVVWNGIAHLFSVLT
jgi:hypothetical protein